MENIRRGIPRIFRKGYKQFSGIEESVLNNIEAVKKFSDILKTSFGPNGLNKLIINHVGKVYVTNDCITIVEQLSVEHPAAKILIHAAAMQEREIGDGSNLVVIFGGELLKNAEKLIDCGIHPSGIINGYEKAYEKLRELLEALVINTNFDVHSIFDLSKACSTTIASKCFGLEDFISTKVAEACSIAIPKNPLKFIVDNVRTLKILGSNVYQTEVVNGMIIHHQSKTNNNRVKNCKVLILTTNIGLREMDVTQNVVFNDADELLAFSKNEEEIVKSSIERISKAEVGLLILSNKPTDLEIFYLNKYNIYTIVVSSKFGRRRLCRMFRARACVTKDWKNEDLGYVQLAKEIEIGGERVTQFIQRPGESIISTIIIRGASSNVMDDLERAIHDGINTIRAMCRENHFVSGGGAVEVELSKRIQEYGDTFMGIEHYSIKSYAKSLQIVPRTLALNSGINFENIVSRLFVAHNENPNIGIDILNKDICNSQKKQIIDLLITKKFAFKLSTNAILTILRIDHIIMSKPKGESKNLQKGYWDNEDDAW